jgi:TolA-binding protein
MKRFFFLTVMILFLASTTWSDELSSVITPVSGETKVLFEKAKTLFDEKNYKECKEILTPLVAQHPMDDFIPQARLLLAKVQEDFELSAAQLKEVAEEYDDKPEGIEAQKELGDRYYLADKYDDAIDAYAEYIDRYEKSPMAVEVHYWLACSYSAADKNKEAIEEYKKVMDKGEKTTWAPKALLGMGNAYFKMKKYSDAENQYLRVLDKYATYEELNLVYLKLGETYELEKKWKQAYAAYQTLVFHFPKAMEVDEAQTRMAELAKSQKEVEPFVTVLPTPVFTAVVAVTPSVVSTPGVEAASTITAVQPTPEEAEQEVTADQPVLKSTPFHVQVGVYTLKANVLKAQKAIQKAGYQSYVVMIKRDTYTVYKVRVGHFVSRSAALKIASVLSKKTKEKAIVIEE